MFCLHFLDRYEIDTDRIFLELILYTVPSDSKKEATFLRPSECFDSTSILVSTSIFDLKKDGNPVFFADNIHFTSLRCDEICLDNLVIMFLEILYSEEFCLIADGSRGDIHSYSTFTLFISLIFTSVFTFGL